MSWGSHCRCAPAACSSGHPPHPPPRLPLPAPRKNCTHLLPASTEVAMGQPLSRCTRCFSSGRNPPFPSRAPGNLHPPPSSQDRTLPSGSHRRCAPAACSSGRCPVCSGPAGPDSAHRLRCLLRLLGRLMTAAASAQEEARKGRSAGGGWGCLEQSTRCATATRHRAQLALTARTIRAMSSTDAMCGARPTDTDADSALVTCEPGQLLRI
jgi:hypothetical protein